MTTGNETLQSLRELAGLLQRLNLLAAGICSSPDEGSAVDFPMIAPLPWPGHFSICRWQLN